jgi:formate dehydrogenase subunit gamma
LQGAPVADPGQQQTLRATMNERNRISMHPDAAQHSTPQELSQVEVAIATQAATADALLPVLHAIQDALGYVPQESVPLIATALNLSRAEIHGVISFYHHFRREKPGRHVVQLCRAEACQAVGARELEAHACGKLGITPGDTSADGTVTLEAAYCLGNCALGPAVMIDGTLHGRVTPPRFDELLQPLRSAP